jgi:SNF2 family DNA or RNA helicase
MLRVKSKREFIKTTLLKKAVDNSPLLDHQQRVIDKLKNKDQPGLILMHGLGSGKTRSSIEAYKSLGLPAEVLVPAALRGNYQKEIQKWVGNLPENINIRSQQEVARKGLSPEALKNKLMIIDEAHRIRNENTKLYKSLKDVSPEKILLLTGTPIYNHPSDIAKLINLTSRQHLLPETKGAFEQQFIETEKIHPGFFDKLRGVKPGDRLKVKNKEKLRQIFKKYIDYHGGNTEGFPEVIKERVRVPMHKNQEKVYKAMMHELPYHLRAKITKNLPPERKELDKLMHFLSGARMINNSTAGFDVSQTAAISPKAEQAFNFLKNQIAKDPEYKGVIYSNYLQSGSAPYKELLTKANIPFGEFTGQIKDSVRNQMIKDYNANKIKALLISSAGAEGLDLKGTRLVQILEPHFNNEKIKQVIGRAARYKSHEGLSPEKRKVLVQNYLSASPQLSRLDKILGKKEEITTDEYLQNMSDEKERLNEEFIKLIKP